MSLLEAKSSSMKTHLDRMCPFNNFELRRPWTLSLTTAARWRPDLHVSSNRLGHIIASDRLGYVLTGLAFLLQVNRVSEFLSLPNSRQSFMAHSRLHAFLDMVSVPVATKARTSMSSTMWFIAIWKDPWRDLRRHVSGFSRSGCSRYSSMSARGAEVEEADVF